MYRVLAGLILFFGLIIFSGNAFAGCGLDTVSESDEVANDVTNNETDSNQPSPEEQLTKFIDEYIGDPPSDDETQNKTNKRVTRVTMNEHIKNVTPPPGKKVYELKYPVRKWIRDTNGKKVRTVTIVTTWFVGDEVKPTALGTIRALVRQYVQTGCKGKCDYGPTHGIGSRG